MMKRIIVFLLTFCMLTVTANAEFKYTDELNRVCESLLNDIKAPTVAQTYGDWAVIALSGAEYDVPADYFDGYIKSAKDFIENGSTRKYTDYARVHLALLSLGKSQTGVEEILKDVMSFKRQGVTGCAYAMIAMNGEGDTEEYLNYILENQHSDGGWGLGKDSDGDVTAIVLQALSRYRNEAVNEAIDKGVDYLNGIEIEFSETAAQCVIAMCDLGLDPYVFAEKLMKYYKDGYFSHIVDGEKNQISTEQGALALTALYRYEKGETIFPSNKSVTNTFVSGYGMDILIETIAKTFFLVLK